MTRDVIESGATQGVGGLTAARNRLDGYVAAAALPRLVQRYRLMPDPGGDVVLRTTTMATDVVADLADGRRHVLAGLDLAGSTDPRERSAGHRILDRALRALRG